MAASSSSILVVRRGWLAAEWHTFNILVPSRFDIWSCVKSFTGTAYGLLFDDCRQGRSSRRNARSTSTRPPTA